MTPLVVLLLLLLAAYAVASANRFVRQRSLVEQAQAQVEVELRRRRDLVPALVDVVRAHETHESALLRELVTAASAAAAAQPGQVDAAEERLTRALHAPLLAGPLVDSGPAQRLQAQLAETEDRIAAARRFHVANVRALEVRLDTFPSALVARALGVERPEPAGLSDREQAELEVPPALGSG